MFEIFISILSILAPFLGIWWLLGVLAKILGYSETVKDGMLLVQRIIFKLFCDSTSTPDNIMHFVDDSQLIGLTRLLESFFKIIILEKATETSNLLSIVYRQQDCSVSLDIIELTFRNFLKEYFNLQANHPLPVFVRMDAERLYLNFAYSEKGSQEVQIQRNNLRSRQIPSTDELTE